MIDEEILQELRQIYDSLNIEGRLLSKAQLAEYYETFRQRFGPDTLVNLDGEALLKKIHGPGKDSLVYWLEFKNDEEFPAKFGSISGGSALKFGIYYRHETQAWMTGGPTKQQEISIEEAIEQARKHRDQLVRGAKLVRSLPADGSDEDYRVLQTSMDQEAHTVSDLAWGHKYFSLLYPSKLDDYHMANYQRYHLIKLVQRPPETEGRYATAGRYVTIANNLGIPLQNLTAVLNERDGNPHSYWRIGTSDGGQPRNRWPLMRDGGFVAIGWSDLGDLSAYVSNQKPSGPIKRLMAEKYYPGSPQVAGKKGQEVYHFVKWTSERDLVVASDGKTVLGVGRVVGEYVFEPTSDFPHRRPVEWLSLEEWTLPHQEGLQTTVHQLRKYTENLVETERRILGASPVPPPPIGKDGPYAVHRLSGLPGRIQSVLDRKRQVILYGPPGTGKTYWAERGARELAALHNFGVDYGQLTHKQSSLFDGNTTDSNAPVRMCSFHPAYGYEDFLEGYRPETVDGQMLFGLRDGVFKKLCHDAQKQPEQSFYLIIDEINRGDIPRIFGELLTVLEKDKRGRPVTLPLSGAPFLVPDNVYLIGTMNTADRSIALLDTALRRRFGFIELMPDSSILGDAVVGDIPLGPWLDGLNRSILQHVGQDARNLQVGHSYLLADRRPITDFAVLCRVLRGDIIPLLEEYCYEDYSMLKKILGNRLVDTRNQRIRDELFSSSKRDDLTQALMSIDPEISTSPQAIASQAKGIEDEKDEEESSSTVDEP